MKKKPVVAISDPTLGPKLGKLIEDLLPKSWLILASTETHPLPRRVVTVCGKRPSYFTRPTLAQIYVYPDKVEIKREVCSDAKLYAILIAVRNSTSLPVKIIK